MRVGTVTEIKNQEYRVGLTPGSVRELIADGHDVLVQAGAGAGVGFEDEQYQRAGASILATAEEVFGAADMIVKVKEPQPVERAMLREGQVLFTYLHLAPDPDQARELMESGATAIAYETVTDNHGGLPLLVPMSEVAGRMSIQVGAHGLEKAHGGRGVLLGGAPGVPPAVVVVIGGGVSGVNAAKIAIGMGARVTILEKSARRLRELDDYFGASARVLYSTRESIDETVTRADLVVGAVLIPGAAAPKLVTREHVAQMSPRSMLVDISIDQGGGFETSRPTTHDDPTYMVDEVIHYCVTNMPGAVPKTSTQALNIATLPFVLALANKGLDRAIADDPHLAAGVNVRNGRITHPTVADAMKEHGLAA